MSKQPSQTAMKLTGKGRDILEALSKKHGVSYKAVVEMALREKAEKDQVHVTEEVKG